MVEFGIFNVEGECLDTGYETREMATSIATLMYTLDEEVWVAKICPKHAGQPALDCEVCKHE